MNKQMSLLTTQMDQQKKMTESLVQLFQRQDRPSDLSQSFKSDSELEDKIKKLKQQNQELMTMNNNLTAQNCQM